MNRIQNIEINESPFNNPEKYSKLIYDKAGQSESYKRKFEHHKSMVKKGIAKKEAILTRLYCFYLMERLKIDILLVLTLKCLSELITLDKHERRLLFDMIKKDEYEPL